MAAVGRPSASGRLTPPIRLGSLHVASPGGSIGHDGAMGAPPDTGDRTRRFAVTVAVDRQGRTRVPVPFDPDEAWGAKPRHHVTGSLGGRGLRGVIEAAPDGPLLVLGPAWCACAPLADGAVVDAVLAPEGPQRADLAPDVAEALAASPDPRFARR
jgi:hypothetical protein